MMHPSRQPRAPYPTRVEPSRLREGLIAALLLVGLAVDIAAFQAALAALNAQMAGSVAWAIAIGLGMMAMLLMVEAGHLEAKRRDDTGGSHGKGIVRLMICVWLALGVLATMVRTSVAPQTDGDPFAAGAAGDPFAGGSDPFAGPVEAGSQSLDLGLFTLYAHDMLTALLMLALYAGVGIAAYLFGRTSYDNALTELRRTRRAQRLAQRRLDRRVAQLERAQAREAHWQTTQAMQSDRREQAARAEEHRVALEQLDTAATAALASRDEARAWVEQAEGEERESFRRVAAAKARRTHLDHRATAQRDEATAHGAAAKKQARHLLHEHLASPVRTVMDPDLPESTMWKI